MASDTQIELVDANGHGLFVDCVWRKDRFVHTIGVVADGNKTPLLRSDEDVPDQLWPCSPPLQQISKQLIDGAPALLGLGMAGKSHYSTSFLLTETEDGLQLLIESACSVHDDVRRDEADQICLRSSYQPFADVQLTTSSTDSQSVLVQKPNDGGTLAGIKVEALNGTLSGTQANSSDPDNSDSLTESLQVSPVDCLQEKTTQWSCRVQLAVNDVSTGV